MASEETKKPEFVVLVSMDGETYEVERNVAEQSIVIKNIIEDSGGESVIPLYIVPGDMLVKVLRYCEKHANAAGEANLDRWDAQYIDVDIEVLYDILKTANFLRIDGLLQLAASALADRIRKAKTPEELRQVFRIENDLTPEEERKIRAENSWAFPR